jgi:competence protein ComEC
VPLVAVALSAYAAGLLLGFGGEFVLGSGVLACALLIAATRRDPRLCAYAALCAAGLGGAALHARGEQACRRQAVALTEWVAILDEASAPGAFVRGRVRALHCELPVHVAVERGIVPAGARAVVRGSAILSQRGLVVQRATVRVLEPRTSLAGVRAAIGRSLDRAFREDAPLARALLIADTRTLDVALRERWATAGIIHMLSISGLHVAIIAAAVQLLLRAARCSAGVATAWTVVLTALYVAVIGAPAPAVRSGIMLGVGALARLFQRPTSPWAALALGAAAPLAEPRVVLDIGYQLSVAGMAGLIASGALARRWVQPRWAGWRAALATGLLASIVTTATTAPLVTWYFGRLSVVAPVVNLVATPIIAVAQPALFLAMVLSPVPPAASFVADAARPLLLALDAVAAAGASVPFAALTIAPSLVGALLAAVASIAAVVACVSYFPARPLILALASLSMAAWVPLAPQRGGDLELHMIDVGQGDAVALRTPRGRWVLFDAGRAWRGGDSGRGTIIPYLRRRGGELHAFVLSHPHQDHVGGAASVLQALRPRTYWDGAYLGGTASYRGSLGVARERGVRWERAHPGDTLLLDGARVTFLAPDSAWVAGLDDANDASVVALVEYGAVRFLLVGDAEREQEKWLLARDSLALRADVLKVGHHGSATSSTQAFLAAVRPRLALVSVGAGNRYGHPNPLALRALAAAGASVLRTDRLGSIVVRTDGRAIEVGAEGDTWAISPR